MLYCPNCKTENKPEASYCRRCGQKFDNASMPPSPDRAETLPKNETASFSPLLRAATAGGLIIGGLLLKQWLSKPDTAPPQERLQQKRYKEASAPSKLPEVHDQVQGQREGETQKVSEACEIVFCSSPTPSFPYYGIERFIPMVYMNFQAEVQRPQGRFVVATGSHHFYVKLSELEDTGTLVEDRERREYVDALREILIKDGWKPSSHGECWYSYRFTR